MSLDYEELIENAYEAPEAPAEAPVEALEALALDEGTLVEERSEAPVEASRDVVPTPTPIEALASPEAPVEALDFEALIQAAYTPESLEAPEAPTSTEKLRSTSPLDYTALIQAAYNNDTSDAKIDLSKISVGEKIAYGSAVEPMILGNVWDVIKAGYRGITSPKTYTQALADITQEGLEEIWEKNPEFRGLAIQDEDIAIMSGRLGAAFIDPVPWLIPWTKAYKLGKISTAMAGAGYGMADAALYGHVKQGEVSNLMLGASAVLGGTAMVASRQLNEFMIKRGVSKQSGRGQEIADNVEETIEEIAQANAKKQQPQKPEIPSPVVVDIPVQKGKLPAQNSATYNVEKEVVEFIEETAETVMKSTNKYDADPVVAKNLSDELREMLNINKLIKVKTKELRKLTGRTAAKTKTRATLKKELTELKEKMAAATLANFKATTERAIKGNELAFDIFDRAIKEDKLSSSMIQSLIRESVRPAVGAAGGLLIGSSLADEDDEWGHYARWTIGGAVLMAWQSKLQKATISSMDKEMGEMLVKEGWGSLLSTNRLKYWTTASTATKLDSLGGVAKVLSNLMFDRPGGSGRALETIVAEETRKASSYLAKTLGYSSSLADERAAVIREVLGEVLDEFVTIGGKKSTRAGVEALKAGYKGLGGRFKTGLSQEEVDFIGEIAPKLMRQRDEIATSVKEVGIKFKTLKEYGLPQIYNFKRIGEDKDKFIEILEGMFRGKDGKLKKGGKKEAEDLYNKITNQGEYRAGGSKSFEEESVVQNFRMFSKKAKDRPLLKHFERTRQVKDFQTRKLLAQYGFIETDVGKTFQSYIDKTIKIREFVKTFGPNGEFIDEAFKIADRAFDKMGSRGNKLRDVYKGQMADSINAYFGVYGSAKGFHPYVTKVIQSMVALTNMARLPLTGVTVSLNEFVTPFKANSFTSALQGIKGRYGKSVPFHKQAGLQYDNAWEREFSALMIGSDNPLDTSTAWINKVQQNFFNFTQLKRVTEVTGTYAFDVGAYRAFEIAVKVAKNSKGKISAALKREINELGLTVDFGVEDSLKYLSKFKNAEEAFEDKIGKQILSRAGQKAMDRDRLIPKVGNRLLFTQSRNPAIRALGQFTSWAQAKTSQTNMLIKRMEDGDAKLAMRILGTTIIANGVIVLWKDFLKNGIHKDEDFDAIETITAAADTSGDYSHWAVSKLVGAIKYKSPQDDFVTAAFKAVPMVDYLFDVGEAISGVYDNFWNDQDWEGGTADIIDVTPIVGTVNKYLNKFDIGLEDESNRKRKTPVVPLAYRKGGEVNVPQAPKEPDERIDKMTGMPYNIQAGMAFIDDEDPLKRLGFTGGGQAVHVDPLVRLGFSGGKESGIVKKRTAKVLGGLQRSKVNALNIL